MEQYMKCTGLRNCICDGCAPSLWADDEAKANAPRFTTFSVAKGTWTIDEMKTAVEQVRKLHEPFKRHTEIVAMPARLVEQIGDALYALEPLRAKLAEARALLERVAEPDFGAKVSALTAVRAWLAANPEAK